MAVINRYRVNWTGFTGAPGLSTFYSDGASTAALAAIRTFFAAISNVIPPSVSLDFPGAGDQLESTTGALVGGWTVTPPAVVNGSAPVAFFAGGTGARVIWETSTIVQGRRVRGSTFLVPLSTSAYDSNGTLISGATALIQPAATTLATAGVLQVWSRPTISGSAITSVTSAQLSDRVTNLRTRRS